MSPEKKHSKTKIFPVAITVATLLGSNIALEKFKQPVLDKTLFSKENKTNPVIYHFMKEIFNNILRLEKIAPVIDDKFTKTRLLKKESLLKEIKELLSRYKRLENVLRSRGINFNASTYFLKLLESKPRLKVYLEHLENQA